MDSLAVILCLAALVAGLGLGWLLRGKAVAPLAAEKVELAGKLGQAEAQRNGALQELVVAQERAVQAGDLARRLDVSGRRGALSNANWRRCGPRHRREPRRSKRRSRR
jgi:hypothetical protein